MSALSWVVFRGLDGHRESGEKLFVGKWKSLTTKSSSCLLPADGRLNVGPGS